MNCGIKSPEQNWIAQAASVLEYLWVTGLAFVVLSVSSRFPCKDASLEPVIYLCMGSVFPLMALLVCLCERYAFLSRFATVLKSFFVLFALYQFREYWFEDDSVVMFCSIPVFCFVIALLYWRSQADRDNPPKRWASAFLIFTISLACWIAVQRMFVGTPSFEEWLVMLWRVIPILITAIGLTVAVLFHSDTVLPVKKWRWVGHLVAFGLFMGLSFQTDSLNDSRVYLSGGGAHHWGFWIGPVESVRDGEWLLWDVPSQYGFLNILTIAALPIADAWEAMYIFQSVLLLLVAAMVYGVLIRWGTRLHNYLFAVFFTVATVFLLSGSIPGVLSGVQPWPSTGPLRYFWLYASISVLWYFLGRKKPQIHRYLWAGSFCWVTGILWSFESGAFCSAIFLSVMCVLLLQQIVGDFHSRCSWIAVIRKSLPYITIPLGMLGVTLSFIWAYYMAFLGNAPDWLGYYEYAVLHTGDKLLVSSFTIQDQAGVLIVAVCIMATIVIWNFKAHFLSPQVALAVGVWFAFWDSLLLFVTIKHPPFSDCGTAFALGVGILIPLVDRVSQPLLARLVRYGLLPIITIMLAITYFHPDLPRVFCNLQLPEKSIARTMYPMEPSACLLLDSAGVRQEDPFVCDYQGYLLPPPRHQEYKAGPYSNSHSWLPKPLIMLSALPLSRQDVYIGRWMNRKPEGGWLLIERPRISRACRVNRNLHSSLPRIIHRLTTLPVNQWTPELRLSFFRFSEGQMVICRPAANVKGRLLLMRLKKWCFIQNVVENDQWTLYRCVPPNHKTQSDAVSTSRN